MNTTAKKGERGIEKFSPYLINATYAVLTAEMAIPIGSFSEELEMKKILAAKQEAEAAAAQEAALAAAPVKGGQPVPPPIAA